MTDESRDDQLGRVLSRSISSLREEIPVRSDWREALLSRIEADRARSRGWRVRPSLAVAAGIVMLIAGAVIGRLSVRPSSGVPVLGNVRFVFVAPGATRVAVVGDFNRWDAQATPLRKLSDGTWIIDVPIDPGRYAYAFVVDGRIVVDPAAPRAEGEFGENSILMVRGS